MSAKKYVVTGGGGFVGRSLASRLAEMGHQVVSITRSDYPKLKALDIIPLRADLASHTDSMRAAFEGADAVFHVAAKVDMWGPYEEFYKNNVLASRNVISVCRKVGVSKLIFTSSPSVVANGADLNFVNEGQAYPEKHLAYYPATKAIAEKDILAANDLNLKTVALRPHLIFGPGDQHLVPSILKKARAGKLVQVGAGQNLSDFTFIEDCVSAHICALQALGEKKTSCAGKAYFISQGEAVNMWEWIRQVLAYHDLPPPRRQIPKSLAAALAYAFEFGARVLPGKHEPLFTRFLVSQMTTSHYFDISSAKADLGFRPKYDMRQAMEISFGPRNEIKRRSQAAG